MTLNYGVRWDYFGVIGEETIRFSLLDSPKLNAVNRNCIHGT